MKLNKTIGRVATTLVATAMLASLAAPAYAANYEAVPGGTTTFEKYLVMDKDANVPTADFTFAIGAGENVAATNDSPAVKGASAEQAALVTVSKDGFVPGDTTYSSVQDGDTLELDTDEKYAVDVVTVDFSQVSFSTPGIYRFTVTESGTVNGVTNDTKNIRYIDVYVVDNNGALSVSNYILHDGTAAIPGDGEYTDKATGFTNTYATENVTLTKQVEGNMGDKSKDFTFTITVTSAGGAKNYTVEASDGTEYPAIAAGTPATVYLSDGESVTIKGLSEGDTYKISEEEVSGYTTKYTTTGEVSEEATTGNETTDLTTATSTSVIFYNISEASTPTGIVMDIAPYALLVVIAAAGCFVFLRKRRED